MKVDLEDIVLVLGVLVFLAGLVLIYWPLTLLAIGAGLIHAAFRLADRRRTKEGLQS